MSDPRELPDYVIRRSPRRRRTISAQYEGDLIVVNVPALLDPAEESQLVPQLVAKLVRKQKRKRAPLNDELLFARAIQISEQYVAPQAGFAPQPNSVRWVTNQNARWGSCSVETGDIRLSHRLQMMPGWVVDVVLVHELSHLVERHHTPRFWELANAHPLAAKAEGFLEGYIVGTSVAQGLTHASGLQGLTDDEE